MARRSTGWNLLNIAVGLGVLGAVVWAVRWSLAPPERPAPVKPALSQIDFTELPGWADDDHAAGLEAFRAFCPALAGRDTGPLAAPRTWQRICDDLSTAGDPPRAFFETRFTVWRVSAPDGGPGLFTGYYEPELRGSRTAEGPYQTPLYARPDDLVEWEQSQFSADAGLTADVPVRRLAGRVENGRLKPYFTRQEITGGALAGRGLEVLWIDDPVDVFFLQIQGSGRVVLDSGETVRVGYDGQNGRPYRAIGRDLVARGAIAQADISMQSIRAWLAANPAQADTVMNANPSFVFFREMPDLRADQGPVGAAGRPLIAGRSLAIDPRYWPYGLAMWLETNLAGGERPAYRRLMIAGDTGGAIKGVVRGDIFFGSGEDAARLAGPMKQPGMLYILLPKDIRLDESRIAVSKRDP